MTTFFVPYAGKKPATVLVNGHKLILLSLEKCVFDDNLGLFGADRVMDITTGDSREEQEKVLNKIAKTVKGGVVVAPPDIHVQEVLRNLETQLPWLQ